MAWEVRPGRDAKWRPLEHLGRTSLVIYWIHVEMVYGLVSLPLHGSLTLPEAALGFVAFTGLRLACSLGKDRVVRWWRMGPHMAVS